MPCGTQHAAVAAQQLPEAPPVDTAEHLHIAAEFRSCSPAAHLQVLFDGPGTLVVDSVSLFPTANVRRGEAEGLANPWPFRQDLLDALKALSPRWVGWVGGHRVICAA
jgi:hypothetical protein